MLAGEIARLSCSSHAHSPICKRPRFGAWTVILLIRLRRNGVLQTIEHSAGKFTQDFDHSLLATDVKGRAQNPERNAYAERWVQSLQQDCLDQFIVFGPDHLQNIVAQYVEHYNEGRSYQARDNLPLSIKKAI